jgi:endoglucanase
MGAVRRGWSWALPWLRFLIVGVLMISSVMTLGAVPAQAGPPLSIAVSGNHFVSGTGATIRLLGVDVPSTEYACDQGWGDSSQPLTLATADAVAAWHANAVRVPLNEDCWLGLNGQPSFGTTVGYRQAIETWVTDLNAAGLYAIVDLHWTAPGTLNADGQRPMPDDHSAAFWTSVARTFQSNHAVVFDAFNEPYSPMANGNSSLAVSWSCWLNGGCPVPVANQDGTINDADTYSAVGMQAMVNAIRATGATQPILLGGLSYANDLSGWLAHEPVDPEHQLAASFHNYFGESCDTTSCWNTTIASAAAQVPVVTGEFDQGYDCASPPTSPSGLISFDNTFMNWADAQGVSYLAWGWWVLGNTATRCSALGDPGDNYALISDYDGTAVSPDGTNLHTHLAALAAGAGLQITTGSLPAAMAKVKYSAALRASGGNPPYEWSVSSGTLPAGLHLRSTGLITGRPRVKGTYLFSAKVVDHKTKAKPHTQRTGTKTLSITVN